MMTAPLEPASLARMRREAPTPERQRERALFGERLRTLRLRAGLKQSELAEALGVHVQTVSNWELGKGEPLLLDTLALLDVLRQRGVHATVDVLVGLAPLPLPVLRAGDREDGDQ